jgi:hypothetical protein
MTQKTNTNSTAQVQDSQELLVATPLSHDVRNAVLIVSVVANLVVFVMWLTLQLTSRYDVQLAAFIFNR